MKIRPLRHPFGSYFWSIWYKKQVAGRRSILFPGRRKPYYNRSRDLLFKRLETKRTDRYRRRRNVRVNLWMLGRNDQNCRQHVISGFKWRRRL